MKYKSYKIDYEIALKAKELKFTVNQYISHLVRLNEEHKNNFAEQTFNTLENVDLKVSNLQDMIILLACEVEKQNLKLRV